MADIVSFSPSPAIFGFGAIEQLPEVLGQRHYKRLLIFTDPQIVSSGILERVSNLLTGTIDFDVFDQVPAEPHCEDMDRQKTRLKNDYDVLLGLGGGSAMDFAKGMSVILTHGGSLGDYLGEGSVPGPVIPVVCVPTTSGTGSQSTQTSVFTIDGVKRGISSEYICPAASVVDPEFTMDLPATVTRNSGYDALMHACESFLARPARPGPGPSHFIPGWQPLQPRPVTGSLQAHLAVIPDGRNGWNRPDGPRRDVDRITPGRTGLQPQWTGTGPCTGLCPRWYDRRAPRGLPGGLHHYGAAV